MSFENWLKYIREAEKTSMVSGKLRKIHYKFSNGREMAEEYSLETGVVQRRSWKISRELSPDAQWDIELGEPMKIPLADDYFVLRESQATPMLTKRITKKNIEWRIRNLPYPIEYYTVTADVPNNAIVVRTKNKKYYKVIEVPELLRCELKPEQERISLHHQYNTLIITYSKPKIVCEMEVAVLKELQNVETETDMADILQDIIKINENK